MLEPRGHKNMWGAVIVPPSSERADLAAFFMNANGYLAACVHSSLGVVTAALHAGVVDLPRRGESLLLEVPSGELLVTPAYKDGSLSALTLRAGPAHLVIDDCELVLDGRLIRYSVVFSGVFFAIVDLSESGLAYGLNDAALESGYFSGLGKTLVAEINRGLRRNLSRVAQAAGVSLVMFYEPSGNCVFRDIVVDAVGSIDRSPCGSGAGALVALLSARDQLNIGDTITVESFLKGQLRVRALKKCDLAGIDAVIPEIEGIAYVTGRHEFVLDEDDPFQEGLPLL